jgi:electron-transferring-flavoprotein dehydrogenase
MSDALEIDIACVGFGPATAGFLYTLNEAMQAHAEVAAALPQVICYERADDIAFGVSGMVTRARGIRASIPDFDPSLIPMATSVTEEHVVYLQDPIGASRRSMALRMADRAVPTNLHALELPYVPPFLNKSGGIVMSLGQFLQFAGSNILASGLLQIWPSCPVSDALIEDGRVCGVRLGAQALDVRAKLVVVGDGPVGAVGRQLDEAFGMPGGHHHREWAVGMKMVVELPDEVDLEPGTVIHTFGFPEPEIFGFLYVHPERVVTTGIFVPSWMRSPVRTSYRYLQHFIQHPYLWRYLRGGQMRSWGAKSLQESGQRGEPLLVGDGYARIGEGSGSTNVLTGSGVDEAWTTGVHLAEGVVELVKAGAPFDKANLERTYVARRRSSWVEEEARVAAKSRDGFHHGVLPGLMGMALVGFTEGRLSIPGEPKAPVDLHTYYRDQIPAEELDRIVEECHSNGNACHDALMDRCGWPPIDYDGQLLVSHQDALLMGGKVQGGAGYDDHVTFHDPSLCSMCAAKVCIEICSGQALTPGASGVPAFDREKCVHCGACLWNCDNVSFRAAAGGLHSTEN